MRRARAGAPLLLTTLFLWSNPAWPQGPRGVGVRANRDAEGATRTHDGISHLPITQMRKTTAVAAVTATMSAQAAVVKNAIHAAVMRPTKNPTTLSTFIG